jgi:hypothetical protein
MRTYSFEHSENEFHFKEEHENECPHEQSEKKKFYIWLVEVK